MKQNLAKVLEVFELNYFLSSTEKNLLIHWKKFVRNIQWQRFFFVYKHTTIIINRYVFHN